MSVFQTTLSTIMVHSDYGDIHPVATVELIDRIIAETKVDREHARRLRLAVGETPAEHRQRLANDKVAEQRREPEEHLTFPIALDSLGDDWTGEVDVSEDTSALREGLMVPKTPPFDGEEHGELISCEPFQGHYSGGGDHQKAYYYESVTSFERIWEDGYIDYECQVCGMAKGSPRAVASHRQVHTKAGEVERDERIYTAEYRANREKRRGQQGVEFVDELPEDPTARPNHELAILNQIIDLVLPEIEQNYAERIDELIKERDEARKNLAELEGEFDALVAMLTSRKKDRS